MNRPKGASSFLAGQQFHGWVLEVPLGSGGNGVVWKAARVGETSVAIKILKSITDETYERFKVETSILESLGTTRGIIPLLQKFIPADKSGPAPWFAMPIAQPFAEYVQGKVWKEIVDDFIKLAGVIEDLHARKIAHRDIKPANFLFYDGQLCLSDFGLVKYPSRTNITPMKRDVGAKFTMAPEMRRNASEADGLPADVYSFAKSLWIALTGEQLGFDGQYNPGSTLALTNYLPEIYTTTIDRLLVECTETEPNLRPSITSVKLRLREWLEICEDFHTRNLTEWSELTHKLFPMGAPARACWTDIDSICAVLDEISKVKGLNHMFYPTGGGNTITSVSRAKESGLIALHVGEKTAEILKPAKLAYESFGRDTSWSYFRLEAAPIQPTGLSGSVGYHGISEELTEISPGHYESYACWQYDEFKGRKLPESARPVSRYLTGAFVFFSTRSIYNQIPDTYDARHNQMTEDDFRTYIEKNV
ncbi:protein kinase [Massilia sp. IC2-477]|uniref:serine/threonine protein kinase n=1 Tax=Massilia sp. IC2-477 TaxID=2887198 RepID=UPI001D0FFF37|nr:protein kinase [Massilia sp. IC2-477]MCC2955337.1 protein kinase [Massilia sp. IC2-477]